MESFHSRTLIARRAPSGFTLIEMLVTLAILGIVTAVAVTGQSTFNQSILLNDTSYTVALSAREAQSLGLSSRKFGTVQNGGYGVDFKVATPKSYTVFADVIDHSLGGANKPSWCPAAASTTPESTAGNCLYDGSGETYQTYNLTRGFTISDFCGKTSSGLTCASGGNLQALDVLYLRPNTSAVITGTTAGGTMQFSCAQIVLKSPTDSTTQTVRMSQLGEVSVGQSCQ